MVNEVLRTKPAELFTAEANKVDRATWFAGCKHASQLQHCHATRGIIVGAVEDLVFIESFVNAKVIQVRAEHDHFACRLRIGATQDTNRVPGHTWNAIGI